MLDKFLTFLKPGGAVLLDVYSLRAFDEIEEVATYARGLLDGFWSSEQYFGFLNTFKYEDDKVVLDKYTIIEEARTRVAYNWRQCYDPDTLGKEFEDRGFVIEEFLGDVALAQRSVRSLRCSRSSRGKRTRREQTWGPTHAVT